MRWTRAAFLTFFMVSGLMSRRLIPIFWAILRTMSWNGALRRTTAPGPLWRRATVPGR